MTAILSRLLFLLVLLSSLALLSGAASVAPASAASAAASSAASAIQTAVPAPATRTAAAASAASTAGSAGIAASQPSAAASTYQPRFKPYAEDIGAVFSVASSLLIAMALGAAAWLLIKEWRRQPLIIEPFDVPKDLQDIGLTGSVVSQQLADQILELQRSAKADDGPADIAFVELPRMQVDLQLPGVAWSVRGAIRYLKQAMNKHERRLLGEIVRSGDAYSMRVRSTQGRALDVPKQFLGAADVGDHAQGCRRVRDLADEYPGSGDHHVFARDAGVGL
jgi:hypothetical protein